MEVAKHPLVSSYTCPKDMQYYSSLIGSTSLLDLKTRSKFIKIPERTCTSLVPARKMLDVTEDPNFFGFLLSEIYRHSTWKSNVEFSRLPVTFRALPAPFGAIKSDRKSFGLPNITELREITEKMNICHLQHILYLVNAVTRSYETYRMENKARDAHKMNCSINEKSDSSLAMNCVEPEVSSCVDNCDSDTESIAMGSVDIGSTVVEIRSKMKTKLKDVDKEMASRKQRQINKHSKKRKRRMKKKNKTSPVCSVQKESSDSSKIQSAKPEHIKSGIPLQPASLNRVKHSDREETDDDLYIVFTDEIDGVLPDDVKSQIPLLPTSLNRAEYSDCEEPDEDFCIVFTDEIDGVLPDMKSQISPLPTSLHRTEYSDQEEIDEDLCIVFEDVIDGVLPDLNSQCTAMEEMSDLWIEFDSLTIVPGNSGIQKTNRSQMSDVSECDSDSEYELDCGSYYVNTSEFDSCSGLLFINNALAACSTTQNDIQHPSFVSRTVYEPPPVDDCDEASEIFKINRKWEDMTYTVNAEPHIPKQVTFAPEEELVHVFPVDIMDRKSEWEKFALERFRFKRRVEDFEKIISPYFTPAYRALVFRRMEDVAS